jgi:hypothetical protein
MTKILKILLFQILVIAPLHAESFSLPPLDNYTTSLGPSIKTADPTEVAYFANRCSVLLYSIGAYFTENGIKAKDKENGEKFTKMAEVYGSVGIALDTRVNKRDPKIIPEQQSIFLNAYHKEMKQSKLASNTVFSEVINNDFDLAIKYYEAFKQLNDAMNKKGN